jgi:GNAT superfamily N-acetyltransferase
MTPDTCVYLLSTQSKACHCRMFEHKFLSGEVEVRVHLLADCPHMAPAVGKICFEEWPEVAIKDFGLNNPEEFTADLLKDKMNRDKVPLVIVAHTAEGDFIGTVTLHPSDMPNHRPDLTPWMACLVVAKEHRRKGVGGELVRCLHYMAFRLGELAGHQGVPGASTRTLFSHTIQVCPRPSCGPRTR